MDANVARLEKIVAIMEGSSLFALEYEDADIEVRLTRGAPAAVVVPQAPVAAAPVAPAPVAAPAPTAPVAEAGTALVRSPIVGTFYRAPSPTARAFVDVGSTVQKGQTLCIVEAMKLMNEIESDVSGRIVEILAENGKPVQYDQPLFKVAVEP
ncbi:MAG: acetyl-CoA carboxylase biotin carboxyl carrier protein [Deltaproteobacteria bacterium]|nr:acetyl-CoA carboxylase biotin carboxyl carrier protein [Deltaproteobacteria bacterium]